RGGVDRQAVKDHDVSCIDPPACPIAAAGLFRLDVSLGVLQPEEVRHLLDLERALSLEAIMQGHPCGVAVGTSCNAGVVLMGVQNGAFEVGEDDPPNGLGMNQEVRTHKPFHHAGQYGMMRQRVEALEAEGAV